MWTQFQNFDPMILHMRFQQVFLKYKFSNRVFPKTMSPYQQWSHNCQKILGERILEKGFLVIALIHSVICLFIYIFIEHLLCLGCWAKFLRICGQIKWRICLPSSWQSSGDISNTIVQWGLKCHNVLWEKNTKDTLNQSCKVFPEKRHKNIDLKNKHISARQREGGWGEIFQ